MQKNTLQRGTAVLGLSLLLTGCGMEVQTEVASEQIDQTADAYLTPDEHKQLKQSLMAMRLMGMTGMAGTDGPTAVFLANPETDAMLDDYEKVERDGQTYYKFTQSNTIAKSAFAENLIELDQNKFMEYNNLVDEMDQAFSDPQAMSEANEGTGANVDLSKIKKPDFASVTYTFEKDVIATNGEVDAENPKKVDFSNAKGKLYAIFTQKAASCKKVTMNLARYTNKTPLRFATDGVIDSISVNGSAYQPDYYYIGSNTESGEEKGIHGDVYDFTKEGTYQVKVALTSGYEKTFSVTYDTTAPKIGLSGKKLKITEKNGIQKVTVKGKKVNYKTYRFKKSGTYTVKATDKAGNTSTKKIKYKA